MKKIVGIAAGRRYENYFNWISQSVDIEVIKLGYEDQNFEAVKRCHGLILTGGEDVHPRFYNKPDYVTRYHLDDIDEARDEFEWKLLDYAEKIKLPLLGICRGLQIANVFYGGTLIPDIPSFGKPDHTKYSEGKDRHHSVAISEGSLLRDIAGTNAREVNSAHHQSVETVGKGLEINAISPDGIVEGLERKEKGDNSFLMLVQWHPERMIDQQGVFSGNIRDRFLKSIATN